MKRVFCIAQCVARRVFPLGVVFSKAPFRNASQVPGYLGRFTHKTAITSTVFLTSTASKSASTGATTLTATKSGHRA